MLKIAQELAETRMDWKTCFEEGMKRGKTKEGRQYMRFITLLHLQMDESISLSLYKDPSNLQGMFLRILVLPYHIWIIKKLGVIRFVQKNFATCSDYNTQLCEKFYLLGIINSNLNP